MNRLLELSSLEVCLKEVSLLCKLCLDLSFELIVEGINCFSSISTYLLGKGLVQLPLDLSIKVLNEVLEVSLLLLE